MTPLSEWGQWGEFLFFGIIIASIILAAVGIYLVYRHPDLSDEREVQLYSGFTMISLGSIFSQIEYIVIAMFFVLVLLVSWLWIWDPDPGPEIEEGTIYME